MASEKKDPSRNDLWHLKNKFAACSLDCYSVLYIRTYNNPHRSTNCTMKLFSYIPSFLKNKFFLAAGGFAVWLLFFDRNDLLTQIQWGEELRSLQKSKKYYTEQIAEERKISEELRSSPTTIEKYAREKHMMKRDNEDLFIVQTIEK